MKTSPRLNTAHNAQGFSIPELMTVLAIMALMLSLAAPSFINTLRNSRVLSASNTIAAAIANARSEAVKRGKMVSFCPSSDGAACGSDWSAGWIVYEEDASVLAGAAPDVFEVLVVGDALNATVATKTAGANDWIRFSSRGIAEETMTLQIKPSTCADGVSFQQMEISLVGRASFTKQPCT